MKDLAAAFERASSGPETLVRCSKCPERKAQFHGGSYEMTCYAEQ